MMSNADTIKNSLLYGVVTKHGVSVMELSPVQVEVIRYNETTLLRVFKNNGEDTTMKLGPDVAEHLGVLLIESARQARSAATGDAL